MQSELSQMHLSMEYMNHRRCTPNWCILHDRIPFIDLTYVVRGKATYFIDGKAYSVGAGDLLCIPKGSERQAFCDANDLIESYSQNFYLESYATHEPLTLPFALVTHIGAQPQLVNLLDELFAAWLVRENNMDMAAIGYAMIILSKLLVIAQTGAVGNAMDVRVQQTMDYINAHSGEELSIGALASRVNLHPGYLSSLFRKCCGCSISQYILRIRVNRAETMLLEENTSVSEIATRCGFSNVYYFSRTFKNAKGVSPTNVRKNGRNRKSELPPG